jgi:hypothetical protein
MGKEEEEEKEIKKIRRRWRVGNTLCTISLYV